MRIFAKSAEVGLLTKGVNWLTRQGKFLTSSPQAAGAVRGGAIGAGVGAVGGALTSEDKLKGAVVGGLAGGALGAAGGYAAGKWGHKLKGFNQWGQTGSVTT